MTVSASKTLIDALQESFTGALRSPDGTTTPVALLWTDADGQWRPLVPTLMKATPELYALGSFAPEQPPFPSSSPLCAAAPSEAGPGRSRARQYWWKRTATMPSGWR